VPLAEATGAVAEFLGLDRRVPLLV